MTVDFKLQFGPFWQFLKKADPKPQFFLVDNEPTRVSIYSNRMPASRGTVNGCNCEMGLQIVVNGVRNSYKHLQLREGEGMVYARDISEEITKIIR